MALTKNGPRKINLLRLSLIFLVCFINKGASNDSCLRSQNDIPHPSLTNCVAIGFAHHLSLRK